jgi:hypothetical protein
LGGIGNKLKGREWENVNYKEEFTGKFRQKKITKKVRIGSKKEFSYIDTWWDLIGLKKYSYSVYEYFELYGACFFKCLCLAIVNSNFQDKNQFKKYIYSYYSYLKELANLIAKKKSGKRCTKEEQISKLINNINLILNDEDFDLPAIATFIENSKVFPTSWKNLLLSLCQELNTKVLFELNNFKILAIRITSSAKEILGEFAIQCLKFIVCYGIFIFQISWELYKFFQKNFKQGKDDKNSDEYF